MTHPAGRDPHWVAALYERMVLIRAFEEAAARLYEKGELPGFLHSSVGQEAVAVGATALLHSTDYITSTHRGHGHVLAKGVPPRAMFAELFGRETGTNGGKGGSMHVMDVAAGVLGANGIVGGGIPIAAGAALGIQMLGGERVVVAFFGDGALNTGAFHESVNLASVWQLPAIFVCEHNGYAESTPSSAASRVSDIVVRAAAYGLPGVAVDGNDLFAVLDAVENAVSRARRGEGPTLVQCATYRWYGHYIGDPGAYRSDAEVAAWRGRDPIARVSAWLTEHATWDSEDDAAVRERVERQIGEAIDLGRGSPRPAPESALADVYAEGVRSEGARS